MLRIDQLAPCAALACLLSLAGAVQAQFQAPMQPQAAASAPAPPKPFEVHFAHQDSLLPMRALIESDELEKSTGYKIHWRRMGGGGDVLKAMAAGVVQIGEAASTSIAQAASKSQNFKLFWILDDIANSEALVVRKGSGIKSIADLKGKRVGTPFGSTSHYQLMAALKQAGLGAKDLDLENMRPQEIASAWKNGDIDAAFIWDPVLAKIKYADKVVKVAQTVKRDQYDQSGKKTGTTAKLEMVDKVEKDPHTILAASGGIARKGFAAFDGLVVDAQWAAKNEGFMVALVQALAKADEDYRKNGAQWTLDAPQVQAVARVARSMARDVPDAMKLFKYPTLAEQASPAWLGVVEPKPAGAAASPGKSVAPPVWSNPVAGGAAKSLADQAAFLKAQNRIQEVKSDYRYYVTDSYVKKALVAKEPAKEAKEAAKPTGK